jgi:hypothetical protein
MCGGKAASNLRSNSCGATWHKWPNASQHGGKIFTVNKLHHDGRRFAIWRNVKYGSHVWMRNDCRSTTFGTESISGGGRCCDWCAEYFNGNVAAERLISGTENKCSSTFANQLL